jgi:hypothetical protein
MGAVLEADTVEGIEGFLLVGHAMKVLRQHDVLDGAEVGNQVELLKDETDFLGTNPIEVAARDGGYVQIVQPDFAGGWAIQAAD